MTQAVPPSSAVRVEADFFPSLKNPAVALCNEAWLKIHRAALKQTSSPYTAERCAGKAYRLALPPLDGYRNICDFIACISYGMLLGAIKGEMGTKLLYAAQVTLTTVPEESKTQTRTEPPSGLKHPPLPHFCCNPTKRKGLAQKNPFRPTQTKNLQPLPPVRIRGSLSSPQLHGQPTVDIVR